jgi:hypothetical protein
MAGLNSPTNGGLVRWEIIELNWGLRRFQHVQMSLWCHFAASRLSQQDFVEGLLNLCLLDMPISAIQTLKLLQMVLRLSKKIDQNVEAVLDTQSIACQWMQWLLGCSQVEIPQPAFSRRYCVRELSRSRCPICGICGSSREPSGHSIEGFNRC